jgi:hypothetical protein
VTPICAHASAIFSLKAWCAGVVMGTPRTQGL